MRNTADRPDLSVIIPAVNGPEILSECLQAIRQNAEGGPGIEIVVIERCGERVRSVIDRLAPQALVRSVPSHTSIPEMRAIGFATATGAVIAVIEDHNVVPANWATRISEAFGTGSDVVGGSVFNAATTTTVDWAAFFCDYSDVINPASGKAVERLTGINVAYRREIIERYSSLLSRGRWEDDYHDAMRRDGVALTCVPEIAVGHKMHYRMAEYLSQRYLYSRSYAGIRTGQLTVAGRALGAVRSLLLPPILFSRIVRRVLVARRHQRELLKSLPFLMVFVCAWAAGESVGYVLGPGDSLARVR